MRILVTGAAGMLGRAMAPALAAHHQVIALTRGDCDLCDETAVQLAFRLHKPEMVMHLAAFTNVDGCELEPAKAEAVNGLATRNVAKAAKEVGAALLYTSTDYVFDGRSTRPYREDDPPNPLSVYGRTKLAGERHVQEALERYFIVRTSWLFGLGGKNFVTTVLRLAGGQSELRIVNDQRGSPTYTRHLAGKLAELILTRAYGIYHLTGGGDCTWFEFARKIIEFSGCECVQVKPISSTECGRPAPRPGYSVLANRRLSALGLGLLPSWEKGLADFLAEIHEGRSCADNTLGKQSAYSKLA